MYVFKFDVPVVVGVGFGNSYLPGVDLLKLQRGDMKEILGEAEGIRLNNALQTRYVNLCHDDKGGTILIYLNSINYHLDPTT